MLSLESLQGLLLLGRREHVEFAGCKLAQVLWFRGKRQRTAPDEDMLTDLKFLVFYPSSNLLSESFVCKSVLRC